jgi:hypothetical protein
MKTGTEFAGSSIDTAQSDTSDSLVEMYNSVFENELFENEFEKSTIRYIVEWLDLTFAYAKGNISPDMVDSKYQGLRKHDTSRIGMGSPIDYVDLDFINTYRENVAFLLRRRMKDSRYYISARPCDRYTSTLKIIYSNISLRIL